MSRTLDRLFQISRLDSRLADESQEVIRQTRSGEWRDKGRSAVRGIGWPLAKLGWLDRKIRKDGEEEKQCCVWECQLVADGILCSMPVLCLRVGIGRLFESGDEDQTSALGLDVDRISFPTPTRLLICTSCDIPLFWRLLYCSDF